MHFLPSLAPAIGSRSNPQNRLGTRVEDGTLRTLDHRRFGTFCLRCSPSLRASSGCTQPSPACLRCRSCGRSIHRFACRCSGWVPELQHDGRIYSIHDHWVLWPHHLPHSLRFWLLSHPHQAQDHLRRVGHRVGLQGAGCSPLGVSYHWLWTWVSCDTIFFSGWEPVEADAAKKSCCVFCICMHHGAISCNVMKFCCGWGERYGLAFKGSLGDRFRCHSSVGMMLECIASLLCLYAADIGIVQYCHSGNLLKTKTKTG